MDNRKKIVLNKKIVIISTIAVVLAVFGISYAYFMAIGQSGEQTITTANLEITFDDSTAIINATDIVPIYTDEVTEKATKKSFSVAKTAASSDIYAKIELSNISVPTALASYDLKWALYEGTNPIATGDFGGKTNGNVVLATNQLINSTTKTYNLYIWINETMIDQTNMMNQTFKATILVSGTNKKENTLASVILGENNANVTTIAPTFTTSSTDRGLFVQQGDITKSEMGFPTYYFRGSTTNNTINSTYIMNNYVSFAGQIWRIVRINEDGSIRIASVNTVSLSSNSNNWNSTKYANYINNYGTETETDSEIKTKIESWYNTNIGNNQSLDNKIIISSFCSDISDNYNAANKRLTSTNPNPIFTCPVGSIVSYEKVGLITADELVYSGAIYVNPVTNNPSYLSGPYHWTLTPMDSSSVFAWKGNGDLMYAPSLLSEDSYDLSARAVINLSPDVVVSGGDGLSADTAYTIK